MFAEEIVCEFVFTHRVNIDIAALKSQPRQWRHIHSLGRQPKVDETQSPFRFSPVPITAVGGDRDGEKRGSVGARLTPC